MSVAVVMRKPPEARWIVMRWEGGTPEPVASAPTYESAYLMMVVAISKGVKARIVPNPEWVLRALDVWCHPASSVAYAEMWQLILNERAKWEA